MKKHKKSSAKPPRRQSNSFMVIPATTMAQPAPAPSDLNDAPPMERIEPKRELASNVAGATKPPRSVWMKVDDLKLLAEADAVLRAEDPEGYSQQELLKEQEAERHRERQEEKQKVKERDARETQAALVDQLRARQAEKDTVIKEQQATIERLRERLRLREGRASRDLAGQKEVPAAAAVNPGVNTSYGTARQGKRQQRVRHLETVLGHFLPNFEFLPGSLQAILHDIPDPTSLLVVLAALDASGGTVKGERVHSAPDYTRRHFTIGTDRDRGRLYYARNPRGRYQVLVTVKKDDQGQERDIERLKRYPVQ